jgi:hypothetical protein
VIKSWSGVSRTRPGRHGLRHRHRRPAEDVGDRLSGGGQPVLAGVTVGAAHHDLVVKAARGGRGSGSRSGFTRGAGSGTPLTASAQELGICLAY